MRSRISRCPKKSGPNVSSQNTEWVRRHEVGPQKALPTVKSPRVFALIMTKNGKPTTPRPDETQQNPVNKKGGMPRFEPTEEQRKAVETMAGHGIPHADRPPRSGGPRPAWAGKRLSHRNSSTPMAIQSAQRSTSTAALNIHLHPKQGMARDTRATEVLYGGASGSGGPPGKRNGQYRHGERTKAAIAEQQKFSALLKMLRAGLTW
jgi:hypothetical protein